LRAGRNRERKMKLEDIKVIARGRGIKPGKMKKTELVRSIQEDEGNSACFNTGYAAACGQLTCLWRDDCV
jgi:hypothetical protein